MLIESSEFLDVADDNGDTALILAARYGHTELVAALIAADANIHAVSNDGRTALMIAAANGRLEIVAALTEAAAAEAAAAAAPHQSGRPPARLRGGAAFFGMSVGVY